MEKTFEREKTYLKRRRKSGDWNEIASVQAVSQSQDADGEKKNEEKRRKKKRNQGTTGDIQTYQRKCMSSIHRENPDKLKHIEATKIASMQRSYGRQYADRIPTSCTSPEL